MTRIWGHFVILGVCECVILRPQIMLTFYNTKYLNSIFYSIHTFRVEEKERPERLSITTGERSSEIVINRTIGFALVFCLGSHSSEKRGLRSTFLSGETLQNLLYL